MGGMSRIARVPFKIIITQLKFCPSPKILKRILKHLSPVFSGLFVLLLFGFLMLYLLCIPLHAQDLNLAFGSLSCRVAMSSILRTSNSASKLISGAYQVGNTATQLPGAHASKSVRVKDHASKLTATHSLQAYVADHVNDNSPFSGFSASKGITVTSRRFVHTDVTFPNFDAYRHVTTLDPTKPAIETEEQRKGAYNAIFYGVGGMVTMLAGREFIQKIVAYKSMAADQVALASIEINLSEIPEGKTKTYEWRGKPVFVRHRTKAEINKERAVNVADLRHPETDNERVKKDEWSVVIGICTHLGCVPIAGAGDYGGYYCPCHGSHYDVSGRIRKGPAPLNLNIPEYAFTNDSTIVVGAS